MDNISDNAIMTALGRQMTLAVAKQVVAAGNLANLNTPGFRTRDVAFDDALANALDTSTMMATHPGHAGGATFSAVASTEAEDLTSRRDGNNVQLDRELLQMTHAGADFAAAQTALSAKFRLIRYAINEGR